MPDKDQKSVKRPLKVKKFKIERKYFRTQKIKKSIRRDSNAWSVDFTGRNLVHDAKFLTLQKFVFFFWEFILEIMLSHDSFRFLWYKQKFVCRTSN